MNRLFPNLLFALLILSLIGCTPFGPAGVDIPTVPTGEAAAPTASLIPTEPAPLPEPTATLAPVTSSTATPVGGAATPDTTIAAPTDQLAAQLLAEYPAGAFEGIQVIPLTPPPGSPPLWAAFSTGLRNFQIEPLPSHFVALYRYENGNWVEAARQVLDEVAEGPDYLDPAGVRQVQIEPDHLWLEAAGGAGAHAGRYFLIMYDGASLFPQATNSSDSPDSAYLEDLNADGATEVILNNSDPYVFFYASGVRMLVFNILRWDPAVQQMVAVVPNHLPESVPAAVREPANRAADLAWYGLWKDAKVEIDAARQAAAGTTGFDPTELNWMGVVIDYNAARNTQSVAESAFPLIANVFYGDYPAAVDLLCPYPPEQIFTAQPAIVMGTPAEGFEYSLSDYLFASANNAVEGKPNLAEAYFLRGWAAYLSDPASPQAREDVAKAAQLAPEDELYASSLEFLR